MLAKGYTKDYIEELDLYWRALHWGALLWEWGEN